MGIIYEPAGRAREYAPLACNLFSGCLHACEYCYCPGIFRRSLADWSSAPAIKQDALTKFGREAKKLAGDPRDILFSFTSDPCQSPDAVAATAEALRIAAAYQLTCTVLTKNPEASRPLWETMRGSGYTLASTVCFLSEDLRATWEPGAPSIASRLAALGAAHAIGIKTWASVEPCVDEDEGIAAIKALIPVTDLIKVGKLNHHPHGKTIDWERYAARAVEALGDHPCLIKDDLKKHLRAK
jgi:DNA repair photolyase